MASSLAEALGFKSAPQAKNRNLHRSHREVQDKGEFPGTIRRIDEDREVLILYDEHVEIWDRLVAAKTARPDMGVEAALNAFAPPHRTLPPMGEPTDAYIRILFDDDCQYDMVLTHYERPPKNTKDEEAVEDRVKWEIAMLRQGLVVEIERGIQEDNDDKKPKDIIIFTKIIVPFERLCREAQYLKLKLLLQSGPLSATVATATDDSFSHFLKGLPGPIVSLFGSDPIEKESAVFKVARLWEFKGAEKGKEWGKIVLEFWGRARSNLMAYNILINMQINKANGLLGHGENLTKLRARQVYDQSFALHDSDYKRTPYQGADARIWKDGEVISLRAWLYSTWAMAWKAQPLGDIRAYFGEKIALYFAWLGFYTSWLVVAAPIGVIVFIYGIIQAARNDDLAANQTVFASIFDNALTPFFAFIMCLWGTAFLEFWKRRNYYLKWDWDVLDFESQEQTRPEYYGTVVRISPITLQEEIHYPAHKRISRLIVSASIVLLSICIVIVTVGILIIFGVFSKRHLTGYWASVLPAVANLITIQVLSFTYDKVSRRLTDWENHKTQTEYDDALIIKAYLFNFVNFYSGLFYILLFKQYFGHDLLGRSDLVDMCFGSCLSEMTIQLAIIFVGKQLIGQIQEVAIPLVKKQWNKAKDISARNALEEKYRAHEQAKSHKSSSNAFHRVIPVHVDDSKLLTYDDSVFNEYNEMVMQFGFVTLFVTAFPLAPLFALLNNLTEIRTDAYKMLTTFQRPIAFQAQDIGMWENIMTAVSYISVLTNAILIAFQSSYMEGVLSSWAGGEQNLLAARLMFILIFEHAVLLFKVFLAYLIPDIPTFVKIAIEREEYVERRARKENNEIADLDSGEDLGNEKRADKEHRPDPSSSATIIA